MYHFFPGGKVQHMIHQIKYQNRQYAAEKLGEQYGHLLTEQPRLQDVDIILPVPLHRRKLRKRGFNQSACFARGLAKTMNKLWSVKNLVRTKHTQTQTGKSRYDRIQSMQDAFTVKKPGKLSGKHLLLVDDVMTTGATLEACLDELKKLPGVRLSVATMAIAE
jgi:ComF family protein